MRKSTHVRGCLLVVAAVAALSASCRIEGKPQPYISIGEDADALRATFNADVGKVRLIVLVSPT